MRGARTLDRLRGRQLAAVGIAAMVGACGGPAAPATTTAEAGVEPGLELSIYTAGMTEAEARAQGFAMIVDRRRLELPGGDGDVKFDEVPDTIDPGSVWFRSFTDPAGTRVLEQSYDHDSPALVELLREQIGEEIVLVRADGDITGVLAHVDASRCVLDIEAGRQVTVPVDRELLGARLPTGLHLSLRPTVLWKLAVERPGEHLVEVVYAARRVTWWATYTAVVDSRDPGAAKVDLSAWATVVNDSSFRFADARVSLVAGEGGTPGAPARTAAETTAAAWVWPIEHAVTLEPRSTRQLRLFAPRPDEPARIELRYEGMPPNLRAGLRTDQYYGNSYQPRVDTFLVIESRDQLPAGLVEVFVRRDDVEEPALVARSRIEATRPGGEAGVPLGPANGVTGTRRQLGFNYDYQNGQINEAFEVKIQNQRPEPVRVVIHEDLYRADGGAQVVNASPKPLSSDGKRVTFALDVPARGTAVASYEAIYRGVSDTVNR